MIDKTLDCDIEYEKRNSLLSRLSGIFSLMRALRRCKSREVFRLATNPLCDADLRKIYKHDRERLLKVAEIQLQTNEADDAGTVAKKKKMAEAWIEYCKKYPSNAKDGGPNIYFERIGDFLKVFGFSYRDMLEFCVGENGERGEVSWPQPMEKSMAALLDTLNDTVVAVLEDEIVGRLPQSVYAELYAVDLSIRHFFALVDMQAPDISYVWGKLSESGSYLKTAYSQRNREGAVYPENLPYCFVPQMAKAFDLSPHFLLGLKDETCLSRKARTERIMDAFCVLPDPWKKRFYLEAKNVRTEMNKKKAGADHENP